MADFMESLKAKAFASVKTYRAESDKERARTAAAGRLIDELDRWLGRPDSAMRELTLVEVSLPPRAPDQGIYRFEWTATGWKRSLTVTVEAGRGTVRWEMPGVGGDYPDRGTCDPTEFRREHVEVLLLRLADEELWMRRPTFDAPPSP